MTRPPIPSKTVIAAHTNQMTETRPGNPGNLGLKIGSMVLGGSVVVGLSSLGLLSLVNNKNSQPISQTSSPPTPITQASSIATVLPTVSTSPTVNTSSSTPKDTTRSQTMKIEPSVIPQPANQPPEQPIQKPQNSPQAAPSLQPRAQPSTAPCSYAAGQAIEGQAVTVDLCTVSGSTPRSVSFVYYLGSEKIESVANCESGTWTTYPERESHRPQSQATQNMMSAVCSKVKN